MFRWGQTHNQYIPDPCQQCQKHQKGEGIPILEVGQVAYRPVSPFFVGVGLRHPMYVQCCRFMALALYIWIVGSKRTVVERNKDEHGQYPDQEHSGRETGFVPFAQDVEGCDEEAEVQSCMTCIVSRFDSSEAKGAGTIENGLRKRRWMASTHGV